MENSNEIEFYRKEIASIDLDTENGWSPDFEEYLELRKTTAYNKAYRYKERLHTLNLMTAYHSNYGQYQWIYQTYGRISLIRSFLYT